MSNIKKGITIGALGLGACGLIGAGASGTFSDSVSGTQSITTASPNVEIATGTAANHGALGKSVTFAADSLNGSGNDSVTEAFTIFNTGKATAKAVHFKQIDNGPGGLVQDLNATVTVGGTNYGTFPASTLDNSYDIAGQNISIAPGKSLDVVITYTPKDKANGLPSTDAGKTFTPKFTVDFNGA